MSELIDGNIEMQVYRGAWTTSYHKLMFNRGRLMNTMFKMIDKRQRTDLFIFHDPVPDARVRVARGLCKHVAKPGTSYGCSKDWVREPARVRYEGANSIGDCGRRCRERRFLRLIVSRSLQA